MPTATPTRIALVAAGGVGFVSGFLPWLQYPIRNSGPSYNAFGSHLFPLATWVPLVCLAAGVLLVLETFTKLDLPDDVLGFSPSQLVTVCGVLATLIALGLMRMDLGWDNGIGAFLGLLSGITLVSLSLLEQHQAREAAAKAPALPDADKPETARSVSSSLRGPLSSIAPPTEPPADLAAPAADPAPAPAAPAADPTPATDPAPAATAPTAPTAPTIPPPPATPPAAPSTPPAPTSDATDWPAPRPQD